MMIGNINIIFIYKFNIISERKSSEISAATGGYRRRSVGEQRSQGVIRRYSTRSKRSSGIRIDTVGRYRSERRRKQEQEIGELGWK